MIPDGAFLDIAAGSPFWRKSAKVLGPITSEASEVSTWGIFFKGWITPSSIIGLYRLYTVGSSPAYIEVSCLFILLIKERKCTCASESHNRNSDAQPLMALVMKSIITGISFLDFFWLLSALMYCLYASWGGPKVIVRQNII